MNAIINIIKKLLRRSRKKPPKVDLNYIIPRANHILSKTDISVNALKVLNRLNSAGFQAYLVGGSVRDLLLRKAPKDFDVSTNATPNQIRNLFRNARIIGRRFKLAHILYHKEIIEVATFRGHEPVNIDHQTNESGMLIRDNVYGTLEEDAWRRDFTINSLYYNIEDGSIIDMTNGVNDIKQRLIRIIGDPNTRYQEDPVRMLRAIRFSTKLKFEIAEETKAPIYKLSHLINNVSTSRLFDEMIKLYLNGDSESVHRLMVEFGLFANLFPATAKLFNSKYPVNSLLVLALESTDTRVLSGKPVTPAFLYSIMLWFPLIESSKKLHLDGMDPLPAFEKAMSEVISYQNKTVLIPKRYTQVMREIWILQSRFVRRTGTRAFHLLQHPRFRAAYDFLALRALAGDESMELANWWTSFQDADLATQTKMIKELPDNTKPKPRKKGKKS